MATMGKNFKFLLSLLRDKIGLEIISDDHLHVKNFQSVYQSVNPQTVESAFSQPVSQSFHHLT